MMKEHYNNTSRVYFHGRFYNKADFHYIDPTFLHYPKLKSTYVDSIHFAIVRDKDGQLVGGVSRLVEVVMIPFNPSC